MTLLIVGRSLLEESSLTILTTNRFYDLWYKTQLKVKTLTQGFSKRPWARGATDLKTLKSLRTTALTNRF